MGLKADPADQALLLELQALDTRLRQVAHRAANLPEIKAVDELAATRARLQRTLAERTGALEDARAELARTEAEIGRAHV